METTPVPETSNAAKRHRGFCFTDFDLNEDFLKGIPCEYLVFGRETCPETKRQHLQGYIYFNTAKSFAACRKILAPRHVVPAVGTAEQNFTYCSKEGDFEEIGIRPAQGSRSDIQKVRKAIQTGNCTMRDVLVEATSYQSVRMAEINLKYFEPARNFKPNVYWFYGKPGSGKSRAAFEMFPDPYPCLEDCKWWEGYDAHETVVIDEYRRDFCKFRTFIKLLDRHPFRVECKGGSRQLRAKNIIITCPYRPEEIWEGRTGEDLYQLTRRITEVRLFTSEQEYKDPLEFISGAARTTKYPHP